MLCKGMGLEILSLPSQLKMNELENKGIALVNRKKAPDRKCLQIGSIVSRFMPTKAYFRTPLCFNNDYHM